MTGEPAPAALHGVTVLDLSRIMAGPWAGQVFAQLGARVIKVERPGGGDDTRHWGPPFVGPDAQGRRGDAAYYLSVNSGKESITADLATAEGQALIRSFVPSTDIVLENFRAGTLTRYGLDYASMATLNPGIVFCSITGFGQDGPRRDEPAYDFLIQAMSGLMSVTGEPDDVPGGGPAKFGVPIVDLMTGMYAAVACLAALDRRRRTGVGDAIDVAMLDVGIAMLANRASGYLVSGVEPVRTGNAHPHIQPQDVFDTGDGRLAVVVGNDAQFLRLCACLGDECLGNDPRFATNADRVAHRVELKAAVERLLSRGSASDWAATLTSAGVPAGPINNVSHALRDVQVVHRDMVHETVDAAGRSVRVLRAPYRFAHAGRPELTAPPLLGEHDAPMTAVPGAGSA
jgi:crotonobetainyl-CoA:carnitine CoA-transferase CaiB-like acyl-CoA transferase